MMRDFVFILLPAIAGSALSAWGDADTAHATPGGFEAEVSGAVSGAYDTDTLDLRGRCPASTLLVHPAGPTHED